jgi:hypothetical protein
MKSILLLIICLFKLQVFSQTITQEVISSGGGFHTQVNASIQFNIGEVLVEDFQNTNCHLQLGFEQGFYGLVGINENVLLDTGLSIFPNPTNGLIFIHSENNNDLQQIELFDITGKILLSQNFSKNCTLDISTFANGVYHLNFYSSKNSISKTFKIIKND